MNIREEEFDRSHYNKYELSQAEYDKSHLIDLELILTQKVKHRVYDEFNSDDIYENTDGSFLIKTKTKEDDWLYNYIK